MQRNMNHEERVERLAVNAKDTAKMLGISVRSLWARANEGAIPTKRLGGRVLFPIESLRNLLTVNADGQKEGH